MSKGLTTAQKAEIIKSEVKTRILVTIYLNNDDEDVVRLLENDTLSVFKCAGEDYIGAMVKRSEIQHAAKAGKQSVKITISDISQDIISLVAAEGDVLTNSLCVIEELIFNGFPADWKAVTAYTTTTYVSPVVKNSYIYECTTAGTTGANEPTWPTVIGNTVSDGTVVWTCRKPFLDDPIQLFSGYIDNPSFTYEGIITFDVVRVLGGYSTESPNTTYDVNCQWVFKDTRCQYSGGLTSCDKTLTACQTRENSVRFGGYPSIPKESVIS